MQPAQLYFDDVREGIEIPSVTFHLSVQRLIMAAASNRDFHPIHHNTEAARATGAPDIFLNNVSCLALWDRTISEYIGILGRVRKVSFRITDFNCAGDTVVAKGTVVKKWREDDRGLIELRMSLETKRGISMKGAVVATLPCRSNEELK